MTDDDVACVRSPRINARAIEAMAASLTAVEGVPRDVARARIEAAVARGARVLEVADDPS